MLAGGRFRMLFALMTIRIEAEHEVPRLVRIAGCLFVARLRGWFGGLNGGRGRVGGRAFPLMFMRSLFGF
jgi:hypothetical protein